MGKKEGFRCGRGERKPSMDAVKVTHDQYSLSQFWECCYSSQTTSIMSCTLEFKWFKVFSIKSCKYVFLTGREKARTKAWKVSEGTCLTADVALRCPSALLTPTVPKTTSSRFPSS
ncbi:hypothetical protein ACOMHN_004912 [Nucella lapillus]